MFGFSTEDESLPLPQVNTGAPKLTALFSEDREDLQAGDDTFEWKPPIVKKPPKLSSGQNLQEKQENTVPQLASPRTATDSGTSDEVQPKMTEQPQVGLIFHVFLQRLYRIEDSGAQTDLGSAGAAFLGASGAAVAAPRSLLLYDSQKKPYLQESVVRSSLRCVPQPGLYCSLYDSQGTTWQALFRSEEDWENFAMQLLLARCADHRAQGKDDEVVSQELRSGDCQGGSATTACRGDAVQVSYTWWDEPPSQVCSLPPAPTGKAEAIRLEIPAQPRSLAECEGTQAAVLSEAVVGMNKAGGRLLALPPSPTSGVDSWRYFSISVTRLKKCKTAPAPAPAASVAVAQADAEGPGSSAPVTDDSMAVTEDMRLPTEESGDTALKSRMARLAQSGGASPAMMMMMTTPSSTALSHHPDPSHPSHPSHPLPPSHPSQPLHSSDPSHSSHPSSQPSLSDPSCPSDPSNPETAFGSLYSNTGSALTSTLEPSSTGMISSSSEAASSTQHTTPATDSEDSFPAQHILQPPQDNPQPPQHNLQPPQHNPQPPQHNNYPTTASAAEPLITSTTLPTTSHPTASNPITSHQHPTIPHPDSITGQGVAVPVAHHPHPGQTIQTPYAHHTPQAQGSMPTSAQQSGSQFLPHLPQTQLAAGTGMYGPSPGYQMPMPGGGLLPSQASSNPSHFMPPPWWVFPPSFFGDKSGQDAKDAEDDARRELAKDMKDVKTRQADSMDLLREMLEGVNEIRMHQLSSDTARASTPLVSTTAKEDDDAKAVLIRKVETAESRVADLEAELAKTHTALATSRVELAASQAELAESKVEVVSPNIDAVAADGTASTTSSSPQTQDAQTQTSSKMASKNEIKSTLKRVADSVYHNLSAQLEDEGTYNGAEILELVGMVLREKTIAIAASTQEAKANETIQVEDASMATPECFIVSTDAIAINSEPETERVGMPVVEAEDESEDKTVDK